MPSIHLPVSEIGFSVSEKFVLYVFAQKAGRTNALAELINSKKKIAEM